MRVGCVAGCLVALLLGSGVGAGEKKIPAKQIIKKALKAVGGKKAVAKLKTTTGSEKGTYYGGGDPLPYTANYTFQYPEKFRMEVQGIFVKVVNGSKGWMSFMGQTKPMTEKQIEVERNDLYAGEVATLIPFLSPKEYEFQSLGESGGTVGLTVSKKRRPDIKLYFDKKSFLLSKSVHKTHDAENKFNEVTQEVSFSKYKEFGGVPVATRIEIKRDGKRFVEADLSEFNVAPTIEAKTFSQP